MGMCALLFFYGQMNGFSQEEISTAGTNFTYKSLAVPLSIEKIKPDRISYFSIYAGPALNGSGDPLDENGVIEEESISTWNQVSTQWQVTKNLRFVLNPRFSVNHNSTEKRFEWENPVLGLAGTWYKYKKFTFGGGLNTIVPFARKVSTREDGLVFNPGGFNSVSYQLTPKISFGSWIWGRAQFYERSTELEDERLSFFYAPIVNYDFNDTFGTSVFYQVNGETNNEYGVRWDEDETANLLFTINVSKYLTLQPMVTVFRETNYKVDQGNFNMWLSGRFL